MKCLSIAGGGLLPMVVYQSIRLALTHRYREQAPSHSGAQKRFFTDCRESRS